MSVTEGSLPFRLKDDDDDVRIASLSAQGADGDDSEDGDQKRTVYSWSTPAMRRLQAARDAGLKVHLIAKVRFGDGRQTRCECGWRCTGKSDREMAETYKEHVEAKKRRAQRRVSA